MPFESTAVRRRHFTLGARVCALFLVLGWGLVGAAVATDPPTQPATQPATRAATQPATAPSPRVSLPPGGEPLTIQLAWAHRLLLAPVRINGQDAGWFVV